MEEKRYHLKDGNNNYFGMVFATKIEVVYDEDCKQHRTLCYNACGLVAIIREPMRLNEQFYTVTKGVEDVKLAA